jgi:hypothetical protein
MEIGRAERKHDLATTAIPSESAGDHDLVSRGPQLHGFAVLEGGDGWHARGKALQMAKQYPGIRRVGQNKYRIRVTMTCPETGKRREVDRLVECENIKDALRMQVELRDHAFDDESATERFKVVDYASKWFERRKPRLKYSTAVRYAEQIQKISAGIGNIYMDQLSPGHVSDWLAECGEEVRGQHLPRVPPRAAHHHEVDKKSKRFFGCQEISDCLGSDGSS